MNAVESIPTIADRIAAVVALGFTPRQAAFLTTVMRHGGVCLQRQYAAFTGTANGRLTREFFERLVADGVVRPYACWRRGGSYYHIHAKPLYRAIGEPDSRNRKALTIPRVVERLMLLDVVLDFPTLRWLGTAREKVAYFTGERGVARADLPQWTSRDTDASIGRYFSAGRPIAVGPDGELVFVYLARSSSGFDVQRFVLQHQTLFERLPRFTVRLVIPGSLVTDEPALIRAASYVLRDPLHPQVLDEFRWYCEARRAVEQRTPPAAAIDLARLRRDGQAFATPRFQSAYRHWCAQGDAAVRPLTSRILPEAWQRGDVRVDRYVLTHPYLRLERAVVCA
jgi:hypothetical protein